MLKTLLPVAISAMLSAASVAVAGDAMSGEELARLLAGGKIINLGGPGSGYAGTLRLNADGTGRGEAATDKGDLISLEGTWHIEKDTFCRTWTAFNDGKEVCEVWEKDGESKVRVLVDGDEVGVNWW